jgi:hypothetical protein
MDPIQIIELCVIFGIVVATFMIINWVIDRYDKCGALDPLCYITNQKTSVNSIIQTVGDVIPGI